jgi:serine protease Do
MSEQEGFMPVFVAVRLRPLAEAALAIALLLGSFATAPATAAVLEDAMARVFTVHSADAEDRFLGSAFLWGSGEVAVTNAHVVGAASEVRLTDASGAEQIALVIAADPSRDVAVLAVKPGRRGLQPATQAPLLGAEVWALGAPLGVEFTVTEGRISALARQVEAAVPIRMLQHDAAVNPGSSGGPLLDATGALVGMNAQIADGSRMFVGIAYAIPAADLARIVQGLIDETLAPLPALGLTARAVDRQLAQALSISAQGLLVDAVKPAGLAATAGILPGDVLLAVNGQVLAKPGDLAFAIEAAQAAHEAEFTVLRDAAVVVLLADLAPVELSGLTLRDAAGLTRVTSYSLQALGISADASGWISAVSQNSPAVFAGVAAGDRIVKIDGIVQDPASVTVTKPVLLLLQGETGTRHVLIDPWATAKSIRPVGGANVLDPDVVVF